MNFRTTKDCFFAISKLSTGPTNEFEDLERSFLLFRFPNVSFG